MGAFVVAIARGEKKCSLTKSMGADLVFDSGTVNLRSELKRLKKIDVVYDPVGGSQFKDVLAASKPETRILPIGFASGEVPNIPANIIMVKNITLIGFQIGTYRSFKPNVLRESFERLVKMWSKNIIDPHIANNFSLDRSNDAIELIKPNFSTFFSKQAFTILEVPSMLIIFMELKSLLLKLTMAAL